MFRKVAPAAEDVAAVRDGLSRMLVNGDRLTWPAGKREAAAGLLETLKEPEPKSLQAAMLLILTVARAQGKK